MRNAREDETPFPERYMDYYTLTKKLQEDIVLQANDTELYTVAIRPHGIFGEGMHLTDIKHTSLIRLRRPHSLPNVKPGENG